MEDENEVIPVFEAVNLSSTIKLKYFEQKDIKPDENLYRFHISLVFHSGLYWATTMIQNMKVQIHPVVVPEMFTELERDLITKHIRVMMDIAETREWFFLWFSDGKRMSNQQFMELRKSWTQTLPQT